MQPEQPAKMVDTANPIMKKSMGYGIEIAMAATQDEGKSILKFG